VPLKRRHGACSWLLWSRVSFSCAAHWRPQVGPTLLSAKLSTWVPIDPDRGGVAIIIFNYVLTRGK